MHDVLLNAPLIFTSFAADPIAFGLAQRCARPGGNATGTVINAVGGEEGLTEELFGFFRVLVPKPDAARHDRDRRGLLGGAERLAESGQPKFGFELAPYLIKNLDDLEAGFSAGLRDSVGAFYISGDSVQYNNMERVISFAVATGTPTVGTSGMGKSRTIVGLFRRSHG